MVKRFLMILGIGLGLFLLIHNAFYYEYVGGYNAPQHMEYAKIISGEFRFPTFQESYENYNPPLFHLVSGLMAKTASGITGFDFYTSLNVFKTVGVVLAISSIYLWYQIMQVLYPRKIKLNLALIILIFSLPVFHKVAVMFNTELVLMFLYSLTFWFFVRHYYPKPSLRGTVVLSLFVSLALLTRMSAFVLLASVFAGISMIGMLKIIPWKKTIAYLVIFSGIIFLLTGWFYIGRKDQGIYQAGRVAEPDIPIWQRQPLNFYTYIPFRFMMTHPIRLSTPLNHIIPIYYSEFWGDFWNYYSQRRYGVSVETRINDHFATTPERVASLALQNQVNLPFTVLMILGFGYLTLRVTKGLVSKAKSKLWLMETIFLFASLLTWIGFLIMNVKYPNWKSDAVKPSYMLNIIPIFVYSGVIFIFEVVKKYRYVFYPILVWLALASVINLWWAYY